MMNSFLSNVLGNHFLKEYFILACFSFLLAVVLSFQLVKLSAWLKVKFKKEHLSQAPFLGGLVIYISFMFILLVAVYYSKFSSYQELMGIILGATFIIVLGIFADLGKLSFILKIVLQAVLVFLIAYFFNIKTDIILLPRGLNFLITLFWVLGIMKAFESLNIWEGIASGVAFWVCLFFFLFSLTGNSLVIGLVFSIMLGILLACLLFNFPFQGLYLGSSGCLFLGYILSSGAIILNYADISHKAIVLFTPIIILMVPLFNVIVVLMFKLVPEEASSQSRKRNLTLVLGQKELKKAKILFYLLSFLSGVTGITIYSLNSNSSGLLLAAALALIVAVGEIIIYRKWRQYA